jgi:hypothetical protein
MHLLYLVAAKQGTSECGVSVEYETDLGILALHVKRL